MSTINEYMETLSDDEKVVVNKYLPFLTGLSIDRIKDIIEAIINQNWQAAYKLTAEAMTTEQLMAEFKAQNASFEAMNAENAENMNQVKNFFTEFLTVATKVAAAAVIAI